MELIILINQLIRNLNKYCNLQYNLAIKGSRARMSRAQPIRLLGLAA